MGRFGRRWVSTASLLQNLVHSYSSQPYSRLHSAAIQRGIYLSDRLTLSDPAYSISPPPLLSFSSQAPRISGVFRRHFHPTGACSAAEQNLYEILGIQKDASQEEIKKAFHGQAKKCHPDRNKNNSAAKRRFQKIREAYETLRDPEERAKYDETLRKQENEAAYGWEFGGSEYAEDIFHNMKPGTSYQDPFSSSFKRIFSEVFRDVTETFAHDVEVELPLSFAEAANGCMKHLSFDADVPCSSCGGTGFPATVIPHVCTSCRGIGKVAIPPFASTCGTCKGTGRIIKESCLLCRGSGVVKGLKKVKVTIPAGVDSGDTIHVPGGGNNGGSGVHSGNLYIKFKVAKDPVFVRDGADIYVDASISFTQAILGGKVSVPSLSGDVHVTIPEGVQHGDTVALRGRGIQKHGSLINYGDQYVRFRIQLPISVNERQRTLLEEFAMEELIRESSASDAKWLYQWLCTG